MAAVLVDSIVEALETLGLSMNEAKAYLALLRSGPLNGNELAKAAEVPSPKIYSVLERLQRKGLVVPSDTVPVTYLPLEPQHLVQMYRSQVNSTLDFLNETLPEINAVKNHVYAWHLEGYERILDRVEQLIRSAEDQVLILLWDSEAVRLHGVLAEAADQGIQLISVKFGHSTPDIGIVYHHGLTPEVLGVEGRAIVLVTDGLHTVLANANEQNEWSGVWSSNPGLAFLARNYIFHEMYLWKIHGQLGDALYESFGENLERLINPTIRMENPNVDKAQSILTLPR